MIKKFIQFVNESLNREELEVGDYITYKGSTYEIIEFDDFTVMLKDEDGDITTKNYNMLSQAILKKRG